MNFEGKSILEQTPVPEKLYRGFVVDPKELSIDMFDKPLVMGLKNETDETKTLDGNEAGVYMSTNPSVVESTNYGNRSLGCINVPKYDSGYGIENSIPIPGCGIIVEVRTEGLHVRKPNISPELRGHYNNGFEGDEWIADEVPSGHYRPTKFTLSLGANDRNKIIVEVGENGVEDIKKAIDEIKARAAQQLEKIELFKKFLEGLAENERLNKFVIERKWEIFQKEIRSLS
jgi:hypothetical protein